MKIKKLIFDTDFLRTLGLNLNSKYSIPDIKRHLLRNKLIFIRNNVVSISSLIRYKLKFDSDKMKYKDFVSFIKKYSLENQMNDNNLCTLLSEKDFNFIKVIEL